jgi:UDP-2-acetamido-2-deoxy-ribo-hexuluronate aminotransferase
MSIPFVDLKSQYKAMKSSIDTRIQKVLDHGAYINGPEVNELETQLAKYTGTKYAIACASGTDALLIPLMALGIGPGDEVITTAFSFIATAEVIALAGATPIYVDIDPVTFNIDPTKLEKAITSKTKAIMPVSLYGQMPDMDAIAAIATKHHIPVIEDAAQSFGATYKGKKSCSLTMVSGTSFFPAKPLGCYGDGGAIFTNDDSLFKAMKEIREHGSESRYYHVRLGINGRLDTIQCAVLLAKMERYAWELEQRNKIAINYDKAFQTLSNKNILTPKVHPDCFSVWAQYTLRVSQSSTLPQSLTRDQFQKRLTDLGIPTSVHYPRIIPDQPAYKETRLADWSNARKAAQEVLSIPMFPDMTTEMQNEIIAKVIKAAE